MRKADGAFHTFIDLLTKFYAVQKQGRRLWWPLKLGKVGSCSNKVTCNLRCAPYSSYLFLKWQVFRFF